MFLLRNLLLQGWCSSMLLLVLVSISEFCLLMLSLLNRCMKWFRFMFMWMMLVGLFWCRCWCVIGMIQWLVMLLMIGVLICSLLVLFFIWCFLCVMVIVGFMLDRLVGFVWVGQCCWVWFCLLMISRLFSLGKSWFCWVSRFCIRFCSLVGERLWLFFSLVIFCISRLVV